MHRDALHVAIGITSLAVLGAWFLVRPIWMGNRATPAAPTQAAGRTGPADAFAAALTNLKEEVAMLRREHEQLLRSMRVLEAALNYTVSLGAPSPSSTEDETGAETDAEPQLPEKEEIVAMLSELDLRLSQELDDPTWSQRAELDIATLLHPNMITGSRVLSVDCHTTLCRVEVEHADRGAQSRLVDHLPREAPFEGGMLFYRIADETGVLRTLIYLARSGYTLLAAAP
jgi:hypothetical protein